MSKKLSGNGMWESSRMMLPEHRERILEHRKELRKKERPLMDEQVVEEYFRLLEESWKTGREITVRVYDPFETIELSGYVSQMDPFLQRLKMVHGFQRTWIDFSDIIWVGPA
mgnify:FL=1